MDIILILIQVILLAVIGILLWQIWRFLNRKDIPDDEPLGEDRASYLTNRLKVLQVCFILEAAASIIQIIPRFFEGS